ncbi:unnamed protein product [Rotaria magnacalcarata]|uniref:Mannan endo-1,6-alpha-mannosidase n=2 Tax=Rotaria magnacalcarata TaxID=392030 RepID=A0A815D777_9BILA|nr:unnamed protein product [Rotaria magnacalcarata]
MITCEYDSNSGLWKNELRWQSGNTLETLANFVSLMDSPLKYVFHQTYINTDMFVGGDCFDDYQWWLLGWLQVYSVEPNLNYLYRAADIYDFVTVSAWNDTICRGGVQWCPKNTYKNAITNELFLLSSMRLHPYASLLARPPTYFLDWALKEWQWFEASGLINGYYLINDGLSSTKETISTSYKGNVNHFQDASCVNNNGTTWTYNQGVILTGLALLYNSTGNATLLDIAQKIADATIQRLTYSDLILKEPCEPNCDNNQQLFKGIFVRHLAYLISYLTDAAHIQRYKSFLEDNAESVWTSRQCERDGLYSLIWSNQSSASCNTSHNASTTSAAWDLFVSFAKTKSLSIKSPSNWTYLGLGNCEDDKNASMPNFNKMNVTKTECRTTAEQDTGAVAYDHQFGCSGIQYCRIRTLSDQHQTPQGWGYENVTEEIKQQGESKQEEINKLNYNFISYDNRDDDDDDDNIGDNQTESSSIPVSRNCKSSDIDSNEKVKIWVKKYNVDDDDQQTTLVEDLVGSGQDYLLLSRETLNVQKPRGRSIKSGEILFVADGWCSGDAIAIAEMFDSSSNEWRAVASRSKRRCALGVGVLNNLLYTIGGHNDTRPISSCRASVGVGVLDGCLYVVCGHDGISCLNLVEKYDPSVQQWIRVASMKTKRFDVAVAVLDGYLYAIGGSDGQCPLNTVERYDPKTNKWSSVSSMNTQRKHHSCAVYNGYICM